MKKHITVLFLAIIMIGLFTACSDQKEATISATNSPSNNTAKVQDVREKVWEQLKSEEKEKVKGNWQDSKLSKIKLSQGMGMINDNTYIGKEVYIVDFPIKSISSNNNMVVYASQIDYKIVGYGYTD